MPRSPIHIMAKNYMHLLYIYFIHYWLLANSKLYLKQIMFAQCYIHHSIKTIHTAVPKTQYRTTTWSYVKTYLRQYLKHHTEPTTDDMYTFSKCITPQTQYLMTSLALLMWAEPFVIHHWIVSSNCLLRPSICFYLPGNGNCPHGLLLSLCCNWYVIHNTSYGQQEGADKIN